MTDIDLITEDISEDNFSDIPTDASVNLPLMFNETRTSSFDSHRDCRLSN
jgi:hypothetical protein